MSTPFPQRAYSVAQGSSSIPAFIFEARDPTENDYNSNMVLYTGWVNTITKAIWYLEALSSLGGVVRAQWRAVGPIVVSTVNPTTADYTYPIGQTWINTAGDTYWGLVDVVGTVATWVELSAGGASGILTLTGNVGGAVTYDMARNINILGETNQVVVTGDPANNKLTISLAGGTQAIDSINVDAHTAPGTDPVVPDTNGLITVTGGQVAAATTANVIQTNSLAANTYTIEVQRSKAEASSTVGSNGVAHFNSADFSVDSNGFVSFIGGGTAFTSINVQTFTSSGTYTPTTGMKYCLVRICGGGGGGGGANSNSVANNTASATGGSGGEYAEGLFSAATIGVSQPVTIGAGGAGGIAGTSNGGAGGTTSLDSLMGASGGQGGVSVSGTTDGIDGTPGGTGGTGGYFRTPGGPGGSSLGINALRDPSGQFIICLTGEGGSSVFGSGGNSLTVTTPDQEIGIAGRGYGSGGGGAGSTGGSSASGGSGTSGIIIITEYI